PRTLTSDLAGIQRIALSPDGRFVAAAADTGIHLWRVEDDLWLRGVQSPTSRTLSLAFDPESQALMVASSDTLQIWRISDGASLGSLSGYCDSITSVACAPGGRTFAAIAREAILWRMANSASKSPRPFPLERRAGQASGAAFSPDGEILALATDAQ